MKDILRGYFGMKPMPGDTAFPWRRFEPGGIGTPFGVKARKMTKNRVAIVKVCQYNIPCMIVCGKTVHNKQKDQ